MNTKPHIRAVIHGSFRRHWNEIMHARQIFEAAGIEVLAPKENEITSIQNGFALFRGEEYQDKRLIELRYLHHLKRLGSTGFSYFVNPEGDLGISTSYELGIAQLCNVPCFFTRPLQDHPAYFPKGSIWKPESLAEYIQQNGRIPTTRAKANEKRIHQIWMDLFVPGSIVATGGIIEYDNPLAHEKQILLVKTHKWGGRYSVVGGRVRRNERVVDALHREILEETRLRGKIANHLHTFDQIKNSGYYQTHVTHLFVDYVFRVNTKKVTLNDEAQSYLWIPAKQALEQLEIEPNAREIVQLYANQ